MNTATTIAAFLCTTCISLLPNILLFIFPNYEADSPMLSIGQALAAGGLLGDVFLHTLPHAMEDAAAASGHGHSHDHDHGHLESIGLAIICGFLIFYLFDVLVRSFGHDHDHDYDHQGHQGHGSCSISNNKNNKASSPTTKSKSSMFTSAVILNLVADSLHNFTDGIAIGASFAGSVVDDHDHNASLISQVLSLTRSRGGLASLAVLFHEIPHELGDFSILVSSGMSKNQAIMTQFSTAIAAYCGTFFGLLGMEQMKSMLGYDLMIPFTAGGFVYLAGVTILPSLLQEKRTFTMRIVQFMSFVIGISFMYLVAVLEHQEGCGHSHSHSSHEHEHEHVDHSHTHERIDHHNLHVHVDHHDHHDHGHGHHHDEF